MNVGPATEDVVQFKGGRGHGFSVLLRPSDTAHNPHPEPADTVPYDPLVFVVRHAITAAVQSMSEARTNGAPGNSMDVLRLEC